LPFDARRKLNNRKLNNRKLNNMKLKNNVGWKLWS
jgi:hypothetical protein